MALSEESELDDDTGLEFDAELSKLGVKFSDVADVERVLVGSDTDAPTACVDSDCSG